MKQLLCLNKPKEEEAKTEQEKRENNPNKDILHKEKQVILLFPWRTSDNVRIVSLLLDKDPEPLKLAKDLIIGRPWDKLDHF